MCCAFPSFLTFVKTLATEPVDSDGQNGSFSRSNMTQQTFVKTLVIEPTDLDGQNNPFSRSNEPQRRLKFFVDVH
ncbi:hypothetical protein H5410_052975 [Solanum commersonii]|uniref:Uncharacterized protein n=1 Tax=Solanum commersonii TaxID=4109 RepID=A0A9J5X4Y4_SOLCO|nr:hypothetical protein H5410_052975 [Solanum commersonii]